MHLKKKLKNCCAANVTVAAAVSTSAIKTRYLLFCPQSAESLLYHDLSFPPSLSLSLSWRLTDFSSHRSLAAYLLETLCIESWDKRESRCDVVR